MCTTSHWHYPELLESLVDPEPPVPLLDQLDLEAPTPQPAQFHRFHQEALLDLLVPQRGHTTSASRK